MPSRTWDTVKYNDTCCSSLIWARVIYPYANFEDGRRLSSDAQVSLFPSQSIIFNLRVRKARLCCRESCAAVDQHGNGAMLPTISNKNGKSDLASGSRGPWLHVSGVPHIRRFQTVHLSGCLQMHSWKSSLVLRSVGLIGFLNGPFDCLFFLAPVYANVQT